MGLFDSIKSFLGLGEEGSGGSEDAFNMFKQYASYIDQQSNGFLDNLRLRGYSLTPDALTRPFQGLDQAISSTARQGANRLRGLAAGLPGELRRSALANTQAAQVSAVNAARVASGGRGGLAFGGGAGAIAAQAGRAAGVQQSALLADALVQGTNARLGAEQAAVGLEQGALSQRLGLAGALSGAISTQGQLMDQWDLNVAGLENARLNRIAGLAGSSLAVGLQGDMARQSRKTGLLGVL